MVLRGAMGVVHFFMVLFWVLGVYATVRREGGREK
jgi:hypothetical protein